VVSQSGDGAEVDNGSTLILDGTKLTGQNNGIVVTDSGGTGLVNIVSLNGANLTSRNFDGIVVTDALANITVANNSTILPGSGILVNATGASNVTLTVDSSSLTGALIAGGTSIADATFQNASHLTGTITNWRNLSVDTTSSWSVTGDSVLTGTVSNAGLIAFTSPSGSNFKTLTVGSYVGTGGTLGLNTFLGADGSPSDKLVINGGTADSSIMRITNAGGPGAETTGNGILVVKAINGGTTAAGAFTLPFGELRAGAFDYDLFRGGLNGSNPDDWFLRSGFTVGPVAPGLVPPGPVPPGPVPPGLGPGEPFPTDPPPNPLPPGLYPIIGPELATDGVVQPIARQLGLTTLGTLHERFGDSLEPCTTAAAGVIAPRAPFAPDCGSGIWGRMFGQQINNRYEAFADPRASGQLLGLQTGVSTSWESLIPGHRDTAGLYFAYGNGHVDVDGLVTNAAATAYVLTRTGKVDLEAYSPGAYWTHYGPTGWYVDVVVQGTFYHGPNSPTCRSMAAPASSRP